MRLSDQDLLELLDGGESDRVEYKETFQGDTPRKAREAVCAFANDISDHNQPGVLFVGVQDDGTPSNIEVTDELLRNLGSIGSDGNILPLPILTVEKRNLKGADMAVAIVSPSDSPPVKYKGRICVRVGSQQAIANAQQERVLNEKRRHKDIPFDLQPISFATVGDLSKSIFENDYLPRAFASDILEANDRSYVERLASCRMIHSVEEPIPTRMGLLAIGIRPQDFIPGAYIQFLRIHGTELADPVSDSEAIGGSVPAMLYRAEEKLGAHNRTAVDVGTQATHQITRTYPMVALQQILRNAVLHRTYENTNAPILLYWFNDRVEIHSAGGPYGRVTVDNFAQAGVTDYRNPNIADIFKTYGLVERFGRGIAMAQEAMEKNGNPPIEFQAEQNHIAAILRERN